MTNLVSYPFLSEKDADQQLVEKDFLMKRSIRTFGKECSWPNVSSDLPLSISLLLSHFHFTILLYTNYLSFSLSLPPSLASTLSISYTHNLTLWLIHTIFLSISYTLYLTLCLIHTLSYSLSHTHCLYLYIIHTLSYSRSVVHIYNISHALSLSHLQTLFPSLGLSLTSHSIIHPLLLTIFPSICLSASLASPLSFLNTNYHLWTHSRSHLLLKISILCYLSHYQKLFSSFSVSPSHSTKLTL